MNNEHIFVLQDGSFIIAHVNSRGVIVAREDEDGKLPFFLPLEILVKTSVESKLAEYLGEI